MCCKWSVYRLYENWRDSPCWKRWKKSLLVKACWSGWEVRKRMLWITQNASRGSFLEFGKDVHSQQVQVIMLACPIHQTTVWGITSRVSGRGNRTSPIFLSVGVSVHLFVNALILESFNGGTWNLVWGTSVTMTCASWKVKVKGQGNKVKKGISSDLNAELWLTVWSHDVIDVTAWHHDITWCHKYDICCAKGL